MDPMKSRNTAHASCTCSARLEQDSGGVTPTPTMRNTVFRGSELPCGASAASGAAPGSAPPASFAPTQAPPMSSSSPPPSGFRIHRECSHRRVLSNSSSDCSTGGLMGSSGLSMGSCTVTRVPGFRACSNTSRRVYVSSNSTASGTVLDTRHAARMWVTPGVASRVMARVVTCTRAPSSQSSTRPAMAAGPSGIHLLGGTDKSTDTWSCTPPPCSPSWGTTPITEPLMGCTSSVSVCMGCPEM